MRKPRHAYTALITPFRDAEINKAAFEADVERQIQSGINGLVVCGTTAETPTLSRSEREWLVRAAVSVADKRVPVIAGAGSNATDTTVETVRAMERLGADAALIVTPYYNRPSQEGLFRHFQTTAAATNLPVVLYNVPQRTGVDLMPETVVRLAQIETIIGIKEATGEPERIALLKRVTPPFFSVYSGDDSSASCDMTAGADGSISVLSNALPATWSELCMLMSEARRPQLSTSTRISRRCSPPFRLRPTRPRSSI